jgi:hypothetical protein
MYFVIPPRNYFFKSNKFVFDFIASRPRFGAKYLKSGHLHPDWADRQTTRDMISVHSRSWSVYDINTKFSNYLATNDLEVLEELSTRFSIEEGSRIYTVIGFIKNALELKQFITETESIKSISEFYIILHPDLGLLQSVKSPELQIPENYVCIQTTTSIKLKDRDITLEFIFSEPTHGFTKKNIYISWMHPDKFIETDSTPYKLWFYRS